MITVTIKQTGVLRRAWRMFITGGNNQRLGHQYNDKQSAVDTARLMFSSGEPVRLVVINSDGTTTETPLR